jgi:hypothetical protein
MHARLRDGDWLVGISSKIDDNRLVYAMRISQSLSMDEYFHDTRFEKKKPKLNGSAIEQCGDNFYYRQEAEWKRLPSPFHNEPHDREKDPGCPVFISDHFYYFGDRRVTVPDDLLGVTRVVRGIKYHEAALVDRFVTWLEANYKPGRLGKPLDMRPRGRTC